MVDEAEHMLTTVDNPYSPFTEWDDWYGFDTRNGHHSLALLGRIIRTSTELSEADQAFDYERAVSDIVRENFSGMHKKVSREDYEIQ